MRIRLLLFLALGMVFALGACSESEGDDDDATAGDDDDSTPVVPGESGPECGCTQSDAGATAGWWLLVWVLAGASFRRRGRR